MGFGIVKLTDLSGDACKIYSVARDGSEDTLLELFIDKFDAQYPKQIDEVLNKLRFMGFEGGAREGFFRKNEGKPGDGVVALLNAPNFPLRLYGIRFGTSLLILGSGGKKGAETRTWQQDNSLREAAEQMILLSALITQRIKDKEIILVSDGSIMGDKHFDEEI
ncbi:MAG: hypothetical protein K6F20_01375 [Bacteroidaceae bacterium]|nr:hypothetical protein [Bacteroidaceae bacterium]